MTASAVTGSSDTLVMLVLIAGGIRLIVRSAAPMPREGARRASDLDE